MNETIFQRLNALSDATRVRLLHLVERHELTVGELCTIVQLPQSTVSRHLRLLTDEGWLAVRSEGTSRYYRGAELGPEASRLWKVVGEAIAGGPDAVQDEARAAEVVAGRRSRSQEYFASAGADWDGVRAEVFGTQPELRALPALLHPTWTVADLGCGTGQLTGTLAPFVRRVIGVDDSADMLAAARRRLGDAAGVDLRLGRLESLPVDDGEADVAFMSLVLHYVAAPDAALVEAARILKPVGRLLVIDMQPHGRDEYRDRMGHVWQGFGRDQMEGWMEAAGLRPIAWHTLPPEPAAKGPLLFVCVARKP